MESRVSIFEPDTSADLDSSWEIGISLKFSENQQYDSVRL